MRRKVSTPSKGVLAGYKNSVSSLVYHNTCQKLCQFVLVPFVQGGHSVRRIPTPRFRLRNLLIVDGKATVCIHRVNRGASGRDITFNMSTQRISVSSLGWRFSLPKYPAWTRTTPVQAGEIHFRSEPTSLRLRPPLSLQQLHISRFVLVLPVGNRGGMSQDLLDHAGQISQFSERRWLAVRQYGIDFFSNELGAPGKVQLQERGQQKGGAHPH